MFTYFFLDWRVVVLTAHTIRLLATPRRLLPGATLKGPEYNGFHSFLLVPLLGSSQKERFICEYPIKCSLTSGVAMICEEVCCHFVRRMQFLLRIPKILCSSERDTRGP